CVRTARTCCPSSPWSMPSPFLGWGHGFDCRPGVGHFGRVSGVVTVLLPAGERGDTPYPPRGRQVGYWAVLRAIRAIDAMCRGGHLSASCCGKVPVCAWPEW